MRQIGEEHRIDPYAADGSKEIPVHPISASLAKAHAVWSRNAYAESAHKYCVRATGMNLESAEMTDSEVSKFNSCLSKYAMSFYPRAQMREIYSILLKFFVKKLKNKFTEDHVHELNSSIH